MFDYDEIDKILNMKSDSYELLILPLNLGECAENETEYNFTYDICLHLCKSDNADLRANALLGLAYLARTHGKLDKEIVFPIIKDEWLNNVNNRGRIEDCIDDINIFLKWNIDIRLFYNNTNTGRWE